MAYYAELNENNEVIHVVYMDKEIITDDNGNRRPGIWFYSGATSRFHFTWSACGQSQETLDTTDPITTSIGVWANWVFQSRNGVLIGL